MADTDRAVLDTLADVILTPAAIEQAVGIVTAALDAAPADVETQKATIAADVKRLDSDLANLVAAIKREHLDGLSQARTFDVAAVDEELQAVLADWRGSLQAEPIISR